VLARYDDGVRLCNIIRIFIQDPTLQDQLSKNFTRQGMTSPTLNYLRLCVILEPMQHLMSQHKQYNVPPRECLKQTLFQRFHAQQRNALQNPALGTFGCRFRIIVDRNVQI
jgi:hypothetical protein